MQFIMYPINCLFGPLLLNIQINGYYRNQELAIFITFFGASNLLNDVYCNKCSYLLTRYVAEVFRNDLGNQNARKDLFAEYMFL